MLRRFNSFSKYKLTVRTLMFGGLNEPLNNHVVSVFSLQVLLFNIRSLELHNKLVIQLSLVDPDAVSTFTSSFVSSEWWPKCRRREWVQTINTILKLMQTLTQTQTLSVNRALTSQSARIIFCDHIQHVVINRGLWNTSLQVKHGHRRTITTSGERWKLSCRFSLIWPPESWICLWRHILHVSMVIIYSSQTSSTTIRASLRLTRLTSQGRTSVTSMVTS